MGEEAIPTWIDGDKLNSQFSKHLNGKVHFAARDGGIVVAGDDNEILDYNEEQKADTTEPSDDCECRRFETVGVDFPCWACSCKGFKTVADGVEILDGEEERRRPELTRSEPTNFVGGETTGLQDL